MEITIIDNFKVILLILIYRIDGAKTNSLERYFQNNNEKKKCLTFIC
ncbi:hypothetical protein HMPREF1860_02264 [Prevotella amnii]|uniref:Uncharacterized protein n=1 Tax=Prevotella amnii TaxID=419005 RepID=A0A134B2U5_9BACT|nr:hypothetical protein HMPREF1860_02264 [Prevotella amnii]